MSNELYVGNNNVVETQALTNDVTDVVDTAATVTCTVYDGGGSEVSGESWPKAMPHDTGGTYRAILSENLGIVAGDLYTVVINVTGSSGEVAKWTCRIQAKNRACDE